MALQLKNLLPDYFPPERGSGSGIWGQQLSIEKGSRVHIVAPSGSGKTSLMHFLYGLRNSYRGELSVDGQSLRKADAEQWARLRQNCLSILLQDLRLFPALTVRQNLEVKRQLKPQHPPAKIDEMLHRLGIGDKAEARCATCSYGENQRVAIIRALLQPFDYLLLDEPFSHLDQANARRAMDLILEEAGQRGAAIVLADLEALAYFPHQQLYHL